MLRGGAAQLETVRRRPVQMEGHIMASESRELSPVAFVANIVATSLFFPALILLLAGNWRWIEGWLLAIWIVVMILFNMAYLYRKDPGLLVERTKRPGSENQKPWDKYLLVVILVMAVIWLIIQPLDAGRFHWSPPFPLWLKVLGGIALIPAFYLIERTTIENTFLSTMVRIQTERKQRVISTGPYGFVRHPLYLGCMLMMIGAPLLLGSIYSLAIALIGTILIAFRIVGEEKMLVEELEGYEDYRKRVKYRLIPLVW
jgi:protein-S-isoprenylcysteine O-methyltransferase Ste14